MDCTSRPRRTNGSDGCPTCSYVSHQPPIRIFRSPLVPPPCCPAQGRTCYLCGVGYDYISVPQPGAAAGAAHASSSDHRLSSSAAVGDSEMAALVEQLKNAVDSIPTFVERCSQMWVLAPPCKHADLGGEVL